MENTSDIEKVTSILSNHSIADIWVVVTLNA